MAQGLRLDLKQSQRLAMTPQLQQAIRLLHMSNLELRDFVEQEVEGNPLLLVEETSEIAAAERGPDVEPLDARLTAEGDHSLTTEALDTGTENLWDIAPGDAADDQRWTNGQTDPDRADRPQEAAPITLREHLLAQLGQQRAAAAEVYLARLLVEELDEHGYLRSDVAGFAARLGAGLEQAEAALRLLQGCEPTGVGARNLSECLALQLAERDRLDPAMATLLAHLDLLGRGEHRRLRERCGVDAEDFAEMLAELRSLDPRPCAAFDFEPAETLIADVILRRAPWGGWDIELNADSLPKVLLDRRYAARLDRGGREVRSFVAECRAKASWLTRSLDQRARTILKVATEIVRRQETFFAEGVNGLRPMTLKMVADATGLHESTASRVTSNKYIATERGIFELKFFFSNEVGADGLTAEAIRQRIRALVESEAPDQVLSDDSIVVRLQELGIDIARRTVVKYRNQLRIPSSVARRRIKRAVA